LGRGELEAIALCKTEGALFATNDLVARQFALGQGVRTISLQAILRGLWVTGICSKTEVRELLAHIKRADRLEVTHGVETEIFGDAQLN
jgi:predicted nucleic acid-binding protein